MEAEKQDKVRKKIKERNEEEEKERTGRAEETL